MSILPKDVTKTIEDRYLTVPRQALPDGFNTKPAVTLTTLASEYREKVKKVDSKLAAAHHDWAVRVELDPENSIPVTEAAVIQRGRWVEFRGMVARIRQPVPRALSMVWECSNCDTTITDSRIGRPPTCTKCKKSGYLAEREDLSVFVDSQNILLAEDFEEIKGSRPPRMLDCRLDGTLIQTLNPGDRCVVGGVLQLLPTKTGHMFELLANNTTKYRPMKRVKTPTIEGDVMSTLIKAFAPNVHGYDAIKASILLLMAGGSSALDGRTNLNILLVGDPGIAKSTLLEEAAAVAPLGSYTSGRGATAAGLTAGMARDRDGVMYMEAGVCVLMDGGLVCIDEFDKTQKADRDALHQVMEQQKASMAKLGTMVTMNARVSILAAANPKRGYWDDGMTLADNVNLPQSLLTRFDLIFNLKDIANEDTDRRIGLHILRREKMDVLAPEEITAYISEVRHLAPAMSTEAADAMVNYYVGARANRGEIRITPRQLEAVKRLAGARAKIYRRKEITSEDATEAIKLVQGMIQHTMVDPVTNRPDHMKATGGQSRSAVRAIDEATAELGGEFTAADLRKMVDMSLIDIERALDQLHHQGLIMEGRGGVYSRIR